ncbi:MAG: DUF3179 domain-containing (seleno)protein [Bacteroidota bacterium]
MKYFPFHINLLTVLSLVLLFSGCASDDDLGFSTPDDPDAIPRGRNVQVVEDEVGGVPIVLAGSVGRSFIVSFRREAEDGSLRSFSAVQQALPIVMEDDRGNRYDVFGTALEGPEQGTRLTPTYGMVGFWFAVGTFYEGVEIYGESSVGATDFIPEATGSWRIPFEEVYLITARDAIPAIDEPQFVSEAQTGNTIANSPLQDSDLVLGVRVGEEIHLYPHRILDWHEIVNDELRQTPFSVIYCPLTGTGNAWLRGQTTFGVSGLLYNTNIIPFDRATETLWSQLVGQAVFGDRVDEIPEQLTVAEMTWGAWKDFYTAPEILSFETGFRRDYSEYPYGDYRTNDEAINFPILNLDERLPAKERVHFVTLNGKTKAYRFTAF